MLSQTLRDLIRAKGQKGVQDFMLEDLSNLSEDQLVMRAQGLYSQMLQASDAEVASIAEELRRTEKELESTFMNLLQQQRAELALVVKTGVVQLEEKLQSKGVAARNELLGKLENERAKALREQFIAFDKQVHSEAEKGQLELAKEFDMQKKSKFSEQESLSQVLVEEVRNDMKEITRIINDKR